MPNGHRPATALLSNMARLVSCFIVPCVLIVFATPFLVLLFYSLPATDDFCKATLSFNTVPQHDVLSITWMYYTQWSPRCLVLRLGRAAVDCCPGTTRDRRRFSLRHLVRGSSRDAR